MSRNLVAKAERTIRSKLASYLTREISLRAFWRWFIPATCNIDHKAPTRLRELVYGIKLCVDDYSSGNISEDQLRSELLRFVETVAIGEGEPSRFPISSSSTPLSVNVLYRNAHLRSVKHSHEPYTQYEAAYV